MTRDLRKYRRQTNFRLLLGWLAILFLVGDGLICFFYGREAAVMGMVCLIMGLAPALLIWIILTFLGWVAKKANE